MSILVWINIKCILNNCSNFKLFFIFFSLKNNAEVDIVKIVIPAFLNLTSLDQSRVAIITHGGHQLMVDYLMKFWSNKKDRTNISDSEVNDILGPLQVLLNIIVSEKETFIRRNED